MKRTIFLIALSALLVACGGSKSSDEQSASQTETVTNEGSFESECRKVYQQVDVLQRKLADPQQYATQQGVEELQKLDQELSFNYNAAELDSAEYAKARQIDSLIAEAHNSIPYIIQQNVCNTPHTLLQKPEELFKRHFFIKKRLFKVFFFKKFALLKVFLYLCSVKMKSY